MLLERGVEIFTLAEDSGRVYVECLGDGVQVDEASCEREVGVCDLSGLVGHDATRDEILPFVAPE